MNETADFTTTHTPVKQARREAGIAGAKYPGPDLFHQFVSILVLIVVILGKKKLILCESKQKIYKQRPCR